MGMSSIVFQRFIFPSRLSNGRGPVLRPLDLEFLLRTMTQKKKDGSTMCGCADELLRFTKGTTKNS
jgi:hypothetical protein